MTVDSTYINGISNGLFTVADSGGTITVNTFNLYLSLATAQVEEDLPSGVSSALKDELIAIMVCHRIVRADNRLEYNSEALDGVSYNKQAGETTWSITYEKMISASNKKNRSVGLLKATHTDASTSLKFDDSTILS